MASMGEKTIVAAQGIYDAADEVGQACGYPPGGGAALHILQEAFAMALADAVNFGDDPMRLASVTASLREQLLERVQMHVVLRKGQQRLSFLKKVRGPHA